MAQQRGRAADAAAKWHRSGPLLRSAWLLFLLAAGWFLVNLVHPVGPPALLSITTPLAAVAATGIFWQTSRSSTLPAAAQRFWRRLTPVAAAVGVGQTGQALELLARPDGTGQTRPGWLVLGCGALAVVLIIYALFRLPTVRPDRGDGLRASLDAGTVMLATAVFVWHFATRWEIGEATGLALAGSLSLIVLLGFIVFALMKVLFSAYAVIDGPGLRLLACGMLVGAFQTLLQPLLTGYDGRLYITQVGVPLIFLCAAEAAARQTNASIGSRHDNGRRRRPFSLVPYAAVAAADGLLIWVACFDLSDIVVVAAVAVLLTVIVVARQVLSLVANGRLVRQLEHSANHDPLTGLPNRSYYGRRLQQALAAPDDRAVTLALIDLDDFKMVNDTLGHEIGDALLIEVARRLRSCVRDGDTVARLGGDEFVVLLERAEPADVRLVTDRMLSAFGEPVRTGEHELPVRASVGIADGRAGDDAGALLRHADIAMYAAKDLPGTAVRHYDESTAAGFLAQAGRNGQPLRTS